MELIERLILRNDPEALKDAFELTRELEIRDSSLGKGGFRHYDEENFTNAHEHSKEIRAAAARLVKKDGYEDMLNLYKSTLLFDAPFDFDCAFRYAEWEREPDKRFYEPRRKQLKPIAEALQRLEERKIHHLLVMMPPGVGKALANETPVLTRYGWKNHGDLVVGDEVIGLNGEFKKVIAVHPKCQLDREIEFSNGEKIVCHERHEWLFYDRGRRIMRLKETKDIEKRKLSSGGEIGHRGHRYTLQLPHRPIVAGEEKELPLDPYTLGVWLGDGANRNPVICCAEKDKCVIDRIVANGIPIRWSTRHKITGVLYFDFNIRKHLRSMGMCHSKKTTPKHIPEVYLTASVEQRLDLLAGLLDTDGTLSGSKYIFTTVEETLRDSFIDLVSTFGWRACVKKHEPVTSSSGVKARRPCYSISFTPNIFIPCELERKRNIDPHKQRAIGFKNIRKVEPKEGNCITVEGDGMYLAGRTMLPTHNTTLAIGFLVWTGMKHPELMNLGVSNNKGFLRGVYDEIMRMVDPRGEYLWHEIFPDAFVCGTNAIDLRIDLTIPKRFQTFQFGSTETKLAGRFRANNILYCDDLVGTLEQSLSADQMAKLWGTFTTDVRQRGIGDFGELIIQTPWSLHDPIDRLEAMLEGNPDCEIIKCPALNEHDESNFDYPYGLGYTTEQFHEQRDFMDEISWKALYMCSPVEREGQLFPQDELKRFFELPQKEPDAVFAVCDTKEQGPDYCAMPIVYKFGEEYYIEDFICDNGNPDMVEERVAQILVDHKVKVARFESNRGGTLFAKNVQEKVKEKGGQAQITTKWNQANKETRILTRSPWVKKYCLFKDESLYTKEYRKAMEMLCTYSLSGKNKNDDVPDVMADLADYVENMGISAVHVVKRFF